MKRQTNDSASKKTVINKNVQLVPKSDSMLTTPTRKNQARLSNNIIIINNDSPVLSQETTKVSWNWNKDGTPIRPLKKLSKRFASGDDCTGDDCTYNDCNLSPKLSTHSYKQSPKGIYKFQEEFRKIEVNADTNDSIDDGNLESIRQLSDHSHDEHFSKCQQIQPNNEINSFKEFLNDSDADQMLLACEVSNVEQNIELNVKDSTSACETNVKTVSKCNGSSWSLVENDDCDDDLLKNVDIEKIEKFYKFPRHKSMPQANQSFSNVVNSTISAPSTHHIGTNLKSLMRHESMPITNNSKPTKYQRSNDDLDSAVAGTSSQKPKCTPEEIEQKRREALQRLRKRNKFK